jgi:uncharacterized protein (TIGR02646 family)
MRKVKKDFGAVPAILLSATCDSLIADSLLTKGKHAFDTKIYGHADVRTALNGIYKSKCAFCETDTSAGAPMQVEHYRPKAKLTSVNTHPGYYWLGYEWSNLLLACSSCNNRKRNRFPVTGPRVTAAPVAGGILDKSRCQTDSAVLKAENPQLVNPEVEADPMQHFRFQADGQIEHRTAPGEESIRFYNLNRASLIVKRRKYVYDQLFKKLLKQFDRLSEGKITQKQLHDRLLVAIEDFVDYMIDDENQYLEFAKTCWNEFDNFFLARFQPHEKNLLQLAYAEVKTLLDAV